MVESGHPKPAAALEMRGICKRFGATVALDQVDFSVRPGEVHALVGENGAGKSTLMKVLSGAHRPDSGRMLLDGVTFVPRHPLDARLKGVGMIYQELQLAPHLTVTENILLGMEPVAHGLIRRREMRHRALKALEKLGHTADIKPETVVRRLSMGQQQVVEIARSLVIGCQVLVLDEPTSSLSQKDIAGLFAIIRALKQQNLAIVYISHFLEEVQAIADRLTVLRDGAVVDVRDVAQVSPAEIVRMMVGREVHDLYPRSPRQRGECVLEISDLAGSRRPRSATLQLHRGEIFGISGLVGAGRTELLRCVFGLDAVRKGRIRVGAYLGPASPVRRWIQGIGLLSEDRKEEGLALGLSLADNVTLSRLRGFGPYRLVLPRRQAEATAAWTSKLDIRCEGPAQKVGDLSGGNQQKAALARLLQHDVDVLLLDEPTRGIDVAAKAKIYQVIDEIAAVDKAGRLPRAILMVSSYIPELLGVCDRVAVMSRGQLGEARPVAELDEHQVMLAATGQSATA